MKGAIDMDYLDDLISEHGFSLQIKPVGSSCNIRCGYCYVKQFRKGRTSIMSTAVLERAVSQCLENSPEPTFSWHGGEPTLAGVDFFQTAMDLIERYKKPKQPVRNMIQTNATNISPEMAKLFYEYQFGVGVSLDGPEYVHGVHRTDVRKVNTHDSVMMGIKTLREAGLSPSVIATVTEKTLPYAKETFRFLVDQGFTSIKFSPVYDSVTDSFSVKSHDWFLYLKQVFLEWLEMENEEIHVRDLDEVMIWLERKSLMVCSSNQSCLMWVSIDPKGNLYPCEYLRNKHSYGNIMTMGLSDIIETKAYKGFSDSFSTLPSKCKACEFYSFCGNGCPATRTIKNKISSKGIYAYCQERCDLYGFIKTMFESELGESLG